MIETMDHCEDSCIRAGNLEKAMFYKWARLDQMQRNAEIRIA
jgi:hypothetical protein